MAKAVIVRRTEEVKRVVVDLIPVEIVRLELTREEAEALKTYLGKQPFDGGNTIVSVYEALHRLLDGGHDEHEIE